MNEWICIKNTIWGEDKQSVRPFKTGDVVLSDKQPNKHFKPAKEVEVESEQKEFDPKTMNKDDILLMTKKQINEKFNLNIDKKKLHTTKKEVLLKMIFDNMRVKTANTIK